MDPDLIRLILVVLGVLLVVGIYLWDRYKRAAPRAPMVRTPPSEEPVDVPSADDAQTAARREPQFNESVEVASADEAPAQAAPRTSGAADDLDPEPADLGNWSESAAQGDPQYTMDLAFDAHDDNDYLSTDPVLLDEVERKLVVLHLVAGDGEFSGPAIEKACLSAHLRLGEMSIYHFHDGASGKVLFSIANMVEPGSFPIDDTEQFTTPGLTLFTQLPGPRDGLQIFEAMLQTGRRLASLLQGELQDERHNKLTAQMERHIVETVVEHRRRLRLARSRR